MDLGIISLILIGFGIGVVAIVGVQVVGVLWIMNWLRHKVNIDQSNVSSIVSDIAATPELDPNQSLNFAFKKQGVLWVLESEKVSKILLDKPSRDQKRKKELLEVSPIKMYGQIKGQSLILRELDGSHIAIELKGCTVQAVSASSLSSRKWAKKFPIKVESKTSVIYKGSKTLYIYLETSWEKEAWCKALYLVSCDQQEKIKWFTQLHEEFHSYLTSLNSVYHSIIKPSVGIESNLEAIERASKPDGTSAKVRQFLKKFSKRTSRVSLENISTWTSLSGNEEKKNTDKLRLCKDAVSTTDSMKTASTAKQLKSSLVDDPPPLSSKSSQSGSQNRHSVISGADEKFGIDEGTLCWNLLISRLFFDVKGNAELKKSILERIQRTLSNMRTPSYIGEVICTDIDTGNVPPCITGMRVLPMEMSEVWALEMDIEYYGGLVLEIETRLEVRELELQRGTEDSNPEPSNSGSVPSYFLEGVEYFGKQLNLFERTNDLQEHKEDVKSTASSSTHGSRLKSIFNSVVKQVSQVPLSLAIRVASLRGTLRLHIKPPPSDQLWYGFTSMPDIDFNLESSVGEHKITSGHFALILINRLKASIQETLVLPNCESICIPWMLAEKDDWVPWNVAPFAWINQESGNKTSTSIDTNNQPSGGVEGSASTSSNGPEKEQKKAKSAETSEEPDRKSSDSLPLPSSSSGSLTLESSNCLEELATPLLDNDRPQETIDLIESTAPSLQSDKGHETTEQKVEDNLEFQKQNHSPKQEDEMPRKMGRKERMLDLRKKMGEKLEEKRRHIEEKSRHIVEKMRGP
ncbi:putative PH domain, MMM1 domain-containing protein [Lupinus albus]|uniref:Putative PH domain, MMM1 domain-containing protein n=1 Tax=Lupinus albus TaxID=3870 RepID=A0A6A4NSZ3_LUPAL|nr:putative PH domain, MMM1 domain-containing protein [Lupinus albus]